MKSHTARNWLDLHVRVLIFFFGGGEGWGGWRERECQMKKILEGYAIAAN